MYHSIIEAAAAARIHDRLEEATARRTARGLDRTRRTSRQDVADRMRRRSDRLDS